MNLEPQTRFSRCDRHPDEPVTGFCASCLRERLAGLDPATRRKNTTTTTTTTSALKSMFKSVGDAKNRAASSSSSSSFLPALRRSKSFSGGRGEGFSGVFEPQRRSCDVRGRSTLWSLFHLDDETRGVDSNKEVWGEIEVETRNLGFSGVGAPVFETREEEEEEEEQEEEEEEEEQESEVEEVEEEGAEGIRVSDTAIPEAIAVEEVEEIVGEIFEEEEVKTMKDHIDLDSKKPAASDKAAGRDLKEIAGNFWSAASVFSKKLQKWRRKQKAKKQGRAAGMIRAAKPVSKRFRETQSEIADYGFGRRSCDTDPRFSLDAGRISFEDPRYSWDEPRASWDGYLIGRTSFPRIPPMVSVIEDDPVVRRSDTQIPVEEPASSMNNEDATTPGGSAQTRDYYSDSSSSQRRRRLERSSSVRKSSASVVAENEETKSISNAKVSPANTDYIPGNKLVSGERDSNSNSLREDCSESFERGSKKSGRWSKAWNILGFIHRGRSSKEGIEERHCRGNGVERSYSESCRGNGVERSYSESWKELRRVGNEETKGVNKKVFRSNSSVSSRNSFSNAAFGNVRSNGSVEINGHSKKRRDEFVLERNRSARYSPSHLDNGLLRFYLTPLRSSSRRSGSGSTKGRSKSSHSFARSVLRLY